MFSRILTVFVFFLTIVYLSDSKSDSVRICVAGNPSQKSSQVVKSCEQLARSKKTHATCVFGVDRLDCLRQVSERKADMTVLEAEDLLFAAATCTSSCSLLVVSEVRVLSQNPYEYQAMVVVRKSAHLRPDLKGAALCHPGWTPQDGRSSLFSSFLEERLAPQTCTNNMSLLEDRIRTTSAYFGPSCKPGAWASEPELDAHLKAKYPSLCAACEVPNSCSVHDKFWGSGGAVTCLKEGAGDVLWTTYSDVRIHFKNKMTSDELEKNYELLCMDGTTQPIEGEDLCVWLARPWQVVVANSKMASEVQKALDMLGDDTQYAWEENLISVFDAHKEYIVNLAVSKPPEDYLATIPGYVGANEQTLTNCNPPFVITWCTTSSLEHKKCTWIAQAAEAFAVSPAISCVQYGAIEKCAAAVSSMETDIVVVPADYQPIALLQHNLQPLLYEDFKASGAGYSLAAVVKKESVIKTIGDLRHSRACFTRHDGLAWRAVLTILREQGYVSTSCSATNVLHDFFSEVCITAGDGLSLCCGKSGGSDPDTAALQCLISNGCDVAFVSNSSFRRNTEGSELNAQDFRLICSESGKMADCSWGWSAASAVMASASLPEVRQMETRQVFAELSRLFIRRNKAKSIVFAMFGSFQDERNVIFQDSSSDLTPVARFMDQRPTSHSMQRIFNSTKYCSTASTLTITSILFTFLIACIFLK